MTQNYSADDASGPSGVPARRRMGGYTPPAAQKDDGDGPPASATARPRRMGAAAVPGPGADSEAAVAERLPAGPSGPPEPAETVRSPQRTRLVPSDACAPPGREERSAVPSGAASQQEKRAPSSTASDLSVGGAGRPAWLKRVAVIAGVVFIGLLVVLAARWLRSIEGVEEFITTYNGHASQPAAAPVGIPAWLGWQHFFNMFLMALIIRTGMAVRTERKPPAYWTAKKGSFFSPRGNTPKKVPLSQWLHQCLDVLWVLNGLAFVVLLLITGHWMRIVPTSWDVIPNMVSAGVQYASLDWPTENGWVHYNALQVMAYFITVFIAAPLAVISGLRFSTWWPANATRLNRLYPVEWARAVHFPVMLYFVGFTIVHVFLVFFTGALANLNHMYTSRDVVDWWGLLIFLASLGVIAAAFFLTKPLFTVPIAAQMGKVSK